MGKLKIIIWGALFASFTLLAAESLNYSGRLVNPDGRPVTGNVNLLVELAYSGSTASILCSKSFTNVPLNNGLFYLKVDFDCGADTPTQVLSNTPVNESVVVRVTNESVGPNKVYPFQAFYAVPFSKVAETSKQLAIAGTVAGQVLKWDGSKWVAGAEAGTGNGSVTSIATGTGLTGGPISTTGTISIANDGVGNTQLATGILRSKIAAGTANYFVVNNGSGFLSEISGASAITLLGLGTAATADIGLGAGEVVGVANLPSCLAGQLMRVTAPPTVTFSCEYPVDATKLALDGSGTMTGELDMGTHKITTVGYPTADEDAATKKYVDDEVGGVNASQWTTGASLIYYTGGSVGIGTATPGEALDVVGNIRGTGKLSLKSDTANYVELQAPASLAATLSFKLPATLGTAGQVLARVGADGSLEWKDVATAATNLVGDITGPLTATEIGSGKVGSTEIADASIVNADVGAAAGIVYSKLAIADGDLAQAKVNGLVAALAAKEPAITAGATTTYIRGDKSLATLSTSVVPEGTNLYFTEPLVLATDLAGYAVGSGALAATDTVLSAFGKLEGQIGAVATASGTAYVDVAGDTMTGDLNMGTKKITNLADPASAQDAATRAYVDAQVTTSTVWSVSGSDIYRASGKVGIGTNAPLTTSTLDVVTEAANGINTFRTYGAGKRNILQFITGNGTLAAPTAVGGAGANVGELIFSQTVAPGVLASGADISAIMEGTPSATSNPVGLLFSTSPTGTLVRTERMRISAAGNVGIGTTAPGFKLDIGGGSSFNFVRVSDSTGAYQAILGADAGGGATSGIVGTLSNHDFVVRTNNSERIRVLNTGNVGIGTATPASILDITSITSGLLIPRMTTAQRDAVATPGAMQIYNTSTNKINFHNGTAWQELGVAGSGVQSIIGGTGLTGGTITNTGTFAVDVGVAAGKIVQLDGSAKIPAIDGSLLTNLSPANLGSAVPLTKGGTGLTAAGATNTILGMNNTGTAMEFKAVSAGTPLSVTNGAGTLSVDLGTVPVTKGGTGLSALTGNRAYTSNALGTALQSFTCNLNEVFGFSAIGDPTCTSLSTLSGFVQNGNSFAAGAVIGTNDNNSFAIETNNVTRMTVDTSGNVGIGTTNPTQILHIKQTDIPIATILLENDKASNVNNVAQYAAMELKNYLGTGAGHPYFATTNIRGNSTTPASLLLGDLLGVWIGQGYNGAAVVQGARISMLTEENFSATASGSGITFATVTNGTNTRAERMRINNAGNVGIGTTAPLSPLSVNGDIKIQNSAATSKGFIFSSPASNWGPQLSGLYFTPRDGVNATTDFKISLWDGTTAIKDRLFVNGLNGNVGIGTTTPAQGKLVVVNADSSTTISAQVPGTIAIKNSDLTNGNFSLMTFNDGQSDTSTAAIGTWNLTHAASSTATLGDLAFFTKASGASLLSERMRINSSGNVGIGTTTPTAALHLKAGTATLNTAPIKLTSGPLLTIPENGAVEFDGTNLFLTSGGTRRALASGAASSDLDGISSINNASGGITFSPAAGSNVYVNNSSLSTSSSTGAFVVAGGAGVGGALNVGGTISSGSSVTSASLYTPLIYGGNTASQNLTLESTSHATKGNIVLAPNGGSVGIGTTAPVATLDVRGRIVGGFGAQNTSGTLDWNDSSNARSGSGSSLLYGSATNGPNATANYYHPFSFEYGTTKDGNGTLTQFAMPYGDSASMDSGMYMRGRYTGTWNNWRKIISENNAGKVGIGTTAPATNLEVSAPSAGYIRASANNAAGFYAQLYGNYSWADMGGVKTSAGNLIRYSGASSGNAATFIGVGDKVTVQDGGNVGIGTSSPSSILNLQSVNSETITLSHTQGAGYDTTINAAYNSAKSFAISNNANEFFGYTPTDNSVTIGGGTGSPILRIKSSAASSARLFFSGANGTDTVSLQAGLGSTSNLGIYTSSTERVRIDASGNVGIGITNPGVKLDVAGDIRASGTIFGVIEPSTKQSYITDVNAVPHMYYSERFPNDGTGTFPFNQYGEFLFQGSTRAGYNNGFSWVTGSAAIGFTPTPTVKMRLTEAGNLGIGTTTPQSRLTVSGALSTSTSQMNIINSEGGNFILRTGISGVSNNGMSLMSANVDGSSATERMVISAAGNVGIGTTGPSEKLEVAGNIVATGGILRSTGGGAGQAAVRVENTYSTSEDWQIQAGIAAINDNYFAIKKISDSSYPFVLTNTGNVGIGTTAPGTKLQLKASAADGLISFSDSTDTRKAYLGLAIAANQMISSASISDLIIRSDNQKILFSANAGTTAHATILPSGNVGIGTATPSTTLNVESNPGASATEIKIKNQSNNVGSDTVLSLWNGAYGTAMLTIMAQRSPAISIIDTSGNGHLALQTGAGLVGIGTTTPSEKLHVVGNILASGTITPSDRRLKKNIEPMKGSLRKIASLNGVTYDWIEPEKHSKNRQIGIIAQDVQKAFPEAVIKTNDGFLAVSYSVLVAPLIEAVKELFNMSEKQSKDISFIKAENKKLTQENADMKSRLVRLENLVESQGRVPANVKAKK